MAKMPRWVEVWGPTMGTVLLLGGFIMNRFDRLEDRIATEIADLGTHLSGEIEENRQAIERNRLAIEENGKSIARLEGSCVACTAWVWRGATTGEHLILESLISLAASGGR